MYPQNLLLNAMGLLACHKRGKFFMLDGRHNKKVSEPTSPFFLSCDGPSKRRRTWFVSSHHLYTPACWPILTCQPSTLSSPPGWGPGHYRLSALKQTTNSDGFLALPDTKKGCQVATRRMTVSAVPPLQEELAEVCQARLWSQQLASSCQCRPMDLHALHLQVSSCQWMALAASNCQ